MTRSAPLLVALTTTLLSNEALAGDVEPLRFAYSAPPVCPDAEAFVKDVHARTTRFEIVESGDGLRSFAVRIVARGDRFLGEMRVLDRGGELTVRTMIAAHCDEVASALAFVTSISIDPKASATQPPSPRPPPSSSEPDPTTPATATASASASPVSPAADAMAFPPPAPAGAPSDRPGEPAEAAPVGQTQHRWRRNGWHLTAGAAASVQALSAPGAVVGDSLFLGIARDTEQPFAPEARISVWHASTANLDAAPGHADLTWTLARAEACPMRWPARGAFDVRPCVEADVGALSAVAVGVPHAQSRTRPWAALGALARVEWVPFEPLVLGAELSLSAPLVREVFYVAPVPVVYQAPEVVAEGGLALGVRFP
jgi:hypothetical protein